MQLRRTIWTRLGIVGAAGGRSADRLLDRTQVEVFRFLWLFLPQPRIARDVRFQHLLLSRFLSEGGQQTLTFGALVSVARNGGSALDVALIGIAALLPPTVLALYGGIVADELPKRVALAGAYTGQAILCFAVATFFDTGNLWVLFFFLFAVNALGQVSSPTESAVLPLVATEEELASAASLINLAAAIGQGFATALFAPLLVKQFGVNTVLYLGGVLLFIAASRVFDLPVGDRVGEWRLRFPSPQLRLRSAVSWLVTHPAVGTMIVVSVLAGTVNVILVTLAPRYAQAVLHTDPANTAYVFAPGAVGVGIALLSAPWLIARAGERLVAVSALFAAAASLFLLGIIDQVGSVIDPVSPLHIVTIFGPDLNERVRTAGLLAVPLAFGVSLTATSVQTYINRRVPIPLQGRTFALQGSLRNGASIIPLLVLGVAAARFGAGTVLLFSPLLLLAVGYSMVAISFRISGLRAPSQLQVVESFWEEPLLRSEAQGTFVTTEE